MLLAPWDLALTSKMSGSAERGPPPSTINQSRTKNYSLWWLLLTSGSAMAPMPCLVPLGQRGSGAHSHVQDIKGPMHYAAAAPLTFTCGSP